MGAFRLLGTDGARVEVASRKAIGLIALLATGRDGERTRQFLQDKLWGSRESSQAQTSLRRELSNLRKLLADEAEPLLFTEGARVRLNLQKIDFDIPVPGAANENDRPEPRGIAEFLEGLDLPGEEGFEDWLREQRALIQAQSSAWEAGGVGEPGPALPLHLVDLSQPTPGFEGRPAVAVLRFLNQTGDDTLDISAEGISEDLIDQLSRLRWLPVIARSSSFGPDPATMDAKAVGLNLGARYLVEGRLRASAPGFTLAVSTIDTENGQVIWSERFRLPESLSNESLAPVLGGLTAVLDARIDHAEQSRAVARPATSRDVNTLIWRGRWHRNRLTRRDSQIARDLFEEALRLEPDNPEVLVQTAWAMGWNIWAERISPEQMGTWTRLARRAMQADPEDGRTHAVLGAAEMFQRNNAPAIRLFRRAIELNPSLPQAHAFLGSALNLAGRPTEALTSLTTSLRLSPSDPFAFHTLGELATAHCLTGKWAEAVDLSEQSLIRRPGYWLAHLVKVNALVRGGEAKAARDAARDMMDQCPGFSEADIDWLPYVDPSWNAYFKDGLKRALDQGETGTP
ncbi:MAG: hypothetical protein RL588_1066 [Pseudomonadota bacterium]